LARGEAVLLQAIGKGMPPGVYSVAGPDLLRLIEEAHNDQEMIWRYALIRTVLDWYRTGIGTAAPLTLVAELMPLVANTGGHPLREEIDDALEWFARPVIGQGRQSRQSVITVLGTDSGSAQEIAVHDYVLDHDNLKRTLPDEIWSAALRLSPDDSAKFRIATAAYNQDRADIALDEMEALAEGGNALAMSNAGVLLLHRDPPGARHWMELAIESADPRVVPLAQANLGGLLLNAGETGRARELLEAAIGSANPLAMPRAVMSLGGQLMLAPAIGLRKTNTVPQASDLLGDLLAEQEDWDGAEGAYQAAIDTADPYWAPLAQVNLGLLRQRRGDTEGARQLLDAAARSGNPEVASLAQAKLDGLLMEPYPKLPLRRACSQAAATTK
jgi:tetratricopeptide (TPR) repeat protein